VVERKEGDTSEAMLLHGRYDYRLVALSVALAMMAAYAALDLAGRVTAAHHRSRSFWVAGGATAMGLGIWSTQCIGMLAFSLPVPVFYYYPTAVVALLVAIAASAVALFTVSRERMDVGACLGGSLAMGVGIAAMHSIGMGAMRLPAMMQYRWSIVALSLVVAVVVSLAALVLAFRVRQEKKASRRKFLSALIMGSAILLTHYTALGAVKFYASDVPFSTRYTVRVSSLGIGLISVSSFLVMMLAMATAFLDRVLATQDAVVTAARDGEARFRMLAEAIPQIVWTAVPKRGVDYCNQRWYELTGLSEKQTLGWGWPNGLHPDDRPVALQNWEKAQSAGEPFEMEYRLRKAAGGYRWHLARATPMRDSAGVILKWFGACADIDDQMHHQQVLEEKIREHTAALMESNSRLQLEMRERLLTQQELNQQNARMVEELTKRSNRATSLAKMAELLQSCSSLKDAFSVVAGMAPKVFPELRCAVVLFNPSHEKLEVLPIWAPCALPANGFGPEDCWALRTGRVHIVAAGDHTAECGHTAASGQYSYCCVPLQAHGEAIGILHFQMIEPGELSEPMISLATMFAEQVGLSVANIRLREALRDQSIRDPLTGLYNRRYMEEMLERETRRSVRAEHGLGVLMLDLDHFKNFNDTYGHDAGDTVLREAAAFLLKSVRAEDIVCRFGGEEFIVILPVADLKVTQARAERIRSKLRELPVLHQGQSLGMVTVSVGVAELPQHGTSRKELIDAADAALYRAKREGRDRVVVADAAPPTDLLNVVEVGESAVDARKSEAEAAKAGAD
jgi:diguanylate cyclase (GGDEF)-like protein/PAS domain S-box-containing protein